jgi:hypothetical protein
MVCKKEQRRMVLNAPGCTAISSAPLECKAVVGCFLHDQDTRTLLKRMKYMEAE